MKCDNGEAGTTTHLLVDRDLVVPGNELHPVNLHAIGDYVRQAAAAPDFRSGRHPLQWRGWMMMAYGAVLPVIVAFS